MTLDQAMRLGFDTGHWQPAIELLSQQAARNPNDWALLNNLGLLLHRTGDLARAIANLQQALTLNPVAPQVLTNLGNALADDGHYEAALTLLHRALALTPDDPECHANLGVVLLKIGRLDDAIAAYERALTLRPDEAQISVNLATAILLKGDLKRGLDEYESRWQIPGHPILRRDLTQPQWDGRDLTGKTILLHAEQGVGDTFQFIRYLPLVRKRNPQRILFQSQPVLNRFFQEYPGIDALVPYGAPTLPPYDFHCPLMSLPRLFDAAIPADVPYIHANARQLPAGGDPSKRKVAVVWSGGVALPELRSRAITFSLLAPLLQIPGITFYSLQKGPASAEAKGSSLVDLGDQLHDWTETAQVIAALDLVISVDTGVAHLAGAMGKPTWVLLGFVPDWRWQLGRSDSPWYPTMRLFRQPRLNDWPGAVKALAEALQKEQSGF